MGSIYERAKRVANAIREARFTRGELAALRRVNVFEPSGTAFTRAILLWEGEDGSVSGVEDIQRIAVFIYAMARTEHSEFSLGQTLAEVGYSEARFERLLRAEGPALLEEIVSAVRIMEANGKGVKAADIVSLLFVQGSLGSDIRLNIARSYFRKQINEGVSHE